jgi:NAD(P)H dehydrogenase (quinone)
VKTIFIFVLGALNGKPAGMFVSTGTLGGGQETTALTTLTFLAHLGMIYVPLGYKDQKLMSLDEIHGGSPYGAGTIAGNGERQPTELELNICETQGYEFANVVKKLTDVKIDNKCKL